MDSTTPFQPWAGNDGAKKDKELADDAKHHRENVNHPKHTQTASYDKDSAFTSSNVPGPSNVTGSGGESNKGKEGKMDSGKIASMQQIVENTLSPEARQRVSQLLEAVESLSGKERLLLYLRLPTGVPPHDPLKQPINPLGSRAELQQTVTWIQTHLEVDPDVSLPKQDVYDEYIAHCMSSNMKPLSTADFGKVMKQVYPSVRPRRLGTRGHSRYCYAGLRKKIKLEVPQLPDLGESSKEPSTPSRETERIVCEWAETKLGIKFNNLAELSRHLLSATVAAARPPTVTPPLTAVAQMHGPPEDPTSRQLMKQLKRKIQTHGTPGRPKKYKPQEVAPESSPSTSYTTAVPHPVKHEGEPEMAPGYDYHDAYVVFEVGQPYPYNTPPRAHPPVPTHEYRPDPYAFEPSYAPRDLTVPPDAAHNLPINLSSDASLDLSTERADWPRRRPPDPPPTRLHLPGKKLILETYQSETQIGAKLGQPDTRPPQPAPPEEFPRTEYLPKKMRAAEILGGKLAAARLSLAGSDTPSTSAAGVEPSVRTDVTFLEDPKNVSNRSKSTAAALAREEQEAASPTRSVEDPTPKSKHSKQPKPTNARAKYASPDRGVTERSNTPDSCCGIDGINIKTGMICQEKHSEILNRERVISICNIDKHDLDDYLNEGNSQENEEELSQYFQQRDSTSRSNEVAEASETADFLEAGLDPQDDHSQGKNEKLCQLRELLAKNLKNSHGSSFRATNQETSDDNASTKPTYVTESGFKPVQNSNAPDVLNGETFTNPSEINPDRSNHIKNDGNILPTRKDNSSSTLTSNAGAQIYNGNCQNVPQSPTTRTQQYDFVPISEGCHSPRTFNSKSPLGFSQRCISPSKLNKSAVMGGSLQTSPISHSTAASPFVSPRNTPVPRSKLCSRPIPRHNVRRRRNPLTLTNDACPKQFAIPNEQKFIPKSACVPGIKYCQPMSAPPSPNVLSCHYKNQMFQCGIGLPNGNSHLSLNFLPNTPFREHMNGEISQPSSADPLSSEVSQFFQDTLVTYRSDHDSSFRSQSVPLKPGMNNMGLLNYKTPVGSVPPTPVPNEFCDFGSLADTCDISKACLNPETLDKIYDAIDSSNDVLNTGTNQGLLSSSDNMTNGCDLLPEQQILSDELNSLIPSDELLDRSNQFNQAYADDNAASQDVEDFLKRTNSLEFDLSDLVTDKSKFYMSRSVPSTPLPYKRTAPSLHIDPQRSRELFASETFTVSNGISSKSVPSTPQLAEEKNVFSYSNRDYLINGNSVEACSSNQLTGQVVDTSQPLTSPLQDMLREDLIEPLTPAADLLADLDKMEGPPYVDL